MTATTSALYSLLQSAQTLGFIGARPIEDHLDQSRTLTDLIGTSSTPHIVDLGSGGGVPGLVIAVLLPGCELTLIEVMERRSDFLDMAIDRLGVAQKVELIQSPAEEAAHESRLRMSADIVTSRGFGPPAMTAEIAAGYLRPRGRLLVTAVVENHASTWPLSGLKKLGYSEVLLHEGRWPVVECVFGDGPVAPHYPRARSAARKRPLF